MRTWIAIALLLASTAANSALISQTNYGNYQHYEWAPNGVSNRFTVKLYTTNPTQSSSFGSLLFESVVGSYALRLDASGTYGKALAANVTNGDYWLAIYQPDFSWYWSREVVVEDVSPDVQQWAGFGKTLSLRSHGGTPGSLLAAPVAQTTASSVPEPSSIALLGLASLALLRRRVRV